MRIVSEKAQKEAADKLVSSLNKMDGVESSLDLRTSGTQNRPIVNATVSPESWRKVAEQLKEKHSVDHCSMITGIHWPESSATSDFIPPIITMVESELDKIMSEISE